MQGDSQTFDTKEEAWDELRKVASDSIEQSGDEDVTNDTIARWLDNTDAVVHANDKSTQPGFTITPAMKKKLPATWRCLAGPAIGATSRMW